MNLESQADLDKIQTSRQWLRGEIAKACKDEFLQTYRDCQLEGPLRMDKEAAAKRSLKSLY